MALDDFASAEDLQVTKAVDPLDVDLFDFPDQVMHDLEPAPPAASEEAEPDADSAVAEAPAPEAAPEAAAPPAPAAPAAAAPAASPTGPPTAAEMVYDPVLDEDIFQFGELFTAGEATAGDDVIPSEALFDEPEDAAPTAATTAEAVEASAATAPAVSANPAPAAPAVAATVAARPRQAALSGSQPPPAFTIAVAEDNPFKNKLVWTFVAGFILTNAVLAILAWQIGSTFKETLDSMRTELATPKQVPLLPSQDGQDSGESQPRGGSTSNQRRIQPAPSERLLPYEQQELRFAESALEEGRYHAARKRLFGLLANRDRHPLSADTIAEAEFMVARSYLVEGKLLGGGQ